MRRMRLWHIELLHVGLWNTPRGCGCSNFEAVGEFKENLTVESKLVVPRKKSALAMSIIPGTILGTFLPESSNPYKKGSTA